MFSVGAAAVLTALIVAAPAVGAFASEQPGPIPDTSQVTVEPSEPLCICPTSPDYGDADFSNEPGLTPPPQSPSTPLVLNPPDYQADFDAYMRGVQADVEASWAASGAIGGAGGGSGFRSDGSSGASDASLVLDAAGVPVAAPAAPLPAVRVPLELRDADVWRWVRLPWGSTRAQTNEATSVFLAKGEAVTRDEAAEEADSLRNRLLMVGLLVVLVIVSVVLLRLHARRVKAEAHAAGAAEPEPGPSSHRS